MSKSLNENKDRMSEPRKAKKVGFDGRWGRARQQACLNTDCSSQPSQVLVICAEVNASYEQDVTHLDKG